VVDVAHDRHHRGARLQILNLVFLVEFQFLDRRVNRPAAALALETLALAAVYAGNSLTPTVTNPLVWALAMGLLAALVAYGRYALGQPA
jgi:hypothetical protein